MPTIYIIYEHFIPIHNMRVTPSFRLAKGQKKIMSPKEIITSYLILAHKKSLEGVFQIKNSTCHQGFPDLRMRG